MRTLMREFLMLIYARFADSEESAPRACFRRCAARAFRAAPLLSYIHPFYPMQSLMLYMQLAVLHLYYWLKKSKENIAGPKQATVEIAQNPEQ